jgi:SAM-dependent methyltransferase
VAVRNRGDRRAGPMAMTGLRRFEDVDFSMLDTTDLVNLALQRSSSLGDIVPRRRDHPDDWRAIYAQRLEAAREEVLARIWEEIRRTYLSVRGCLVALRPARVADIGCGQAFVDLLIHDDTGAHLTLIDIEESDGVFFGFNRDGGAGYASLDRARAFLVANGVAAQATTVVNPGRQDPADLPVVDVACSFLSCGFHYPVDLYETYFRDRVRRAILLDLRAGRDADALARLGKPFVVTEGRRHSGVLVLKPDAAAAQRN